MAQNVIVDPSSRLIFGDFVSDQGFEYFDMLNLPIPEPQADDTTYEWKSTDRVDLVAFRFYGASALWYVLALANGIDEPLTEITEGTVLRVPSPRYVQQVWVPTARSRARDRR